MGHQQNVPFKPDLMVSSSIPWYQELNQAQTRQSGPGCKSACGVGLRKFAMLTARTRLERPEDAKGAVNN
jgi:hypothetical protein